MNHRLITAAASIAVSIAVSLSVGAFADPPSLDEQLGLEKPATETKPAPKPDPAPEPEPGAKPAPADGVVKPKPEENFAAAVAEMTQASARLAEDDPTLPTQRIQQQVIDRLDMLIADARKKQSKSQSKSKSQQQDTGSKPSAGPPQQSGSRPQNSQSSESADQAGASGTVQNRDETQPLGEANEEWAKLPPRVRDELLQGLDDKFSDLYRGLTERYYKRLAEENP